MVFIMKRFYKNTHIVGNIGIPIFNIIDKLNKKMKKHILSLNFQAFN